MAAVLQSPVNAVQVGQYFVAQYYPILQKQPNLAFQFYTDASILVRIDGATTETATSTLQIHSLLVAPYFDGIEIQTLHSLNSWDNGVLVMVSGLVQMKNCIGRRKFVQTFFLAPQQTGYFVHNDIFHLLDEETVPQLSPVSLPLNSYEGNSNADNHHIPETVSGYMVGEELSDRDYAAPVNEVEEELQVREYFAPLHIDENDTVDKYSIPEPQQPQQVSETYETYDVVEETHTDEPVVSFPSAITAVEDPPAPVEEHVERPKLTYASILRLAKGQPGNKVSRAATVSKPAPVVSDDDLSTPQNPYPPSSERSTLETIDDVPRVEDEGEVKSVYVGNLSSSVSADDLEHEFKNFGRISPGGVTVRSRKDSGGFYAFVEFEDAASVQNALKASPILINGRQIYVEERKPSMGISRLGGGRRGRGGYQSEYSRGRFGGRGLINSRPVRGNGILQRVPRQERGILGNHANARNYEQNPSEAEYY